MMTPSARGGLRSVAPVTDRMQAFEVIKEARELLDRARILVASAYVGAPSHSEQENALGECLTFIRKGIEKTTKAGTDLSQLEMDFENAAPREV